MEIHCGAGGKVGRKAVRRDVGGVYAPDGALLYSFLFYEKPVHETILAEPDRVPSAAGADPLAGRFHGLLRVCQVDRYRPHEKKVFSGKI
jgi:hypothetical protein